MAMPLRLKKVLFGGPSWVLPGAATHLNFVYQRYFWNGAERSASDFTTFTGGTFNNGLVTTATATDRDISIAWSAINLTLPCALIVNYTPNSVTGIQYAAALDLDANNYMGVGTNSTSHLSFVVLAGATQVAQNVAGAAIGTRATQGVNLQTNNCLQSINGSTGGTADTVNTLPSPTTLRISERTSNLNPINGTIHHIVLASGARTQAELNALTAAVHAL